MHCNTKRLLYCEPIIYNYYIMNQLVAGQLDEMAPNSWCVLCLRSNWQCVLCFKLGEMRNNSGVFCRQDWLFLFTGRLSLRRYDDNLIGMGTDSGSFQTFSDFCCWPEQMEALATKWNFITSDAIIVTKWTEALMTKWWKSEPIWKQSLGYLDALDSWYKKKPWKIGHIFDKWISFHLREYNSTVSRALNRLVL